MGHPRLVSYSHVPNNSPTTVSLKYSSTHNVSYSCLCVGCVLARNSKRMCLMFVFACLLMIFIDIGFFEHTGIIAKISQAKGGASLTFMVIGDIGNEGWPSQRKTADAMNRVCEVEQIDFIACTGDTLYPHGVQDLNHWNSQLNM